jgi:hypothetical protein
MARDWNDWHRAYDDPSSELSQRRLGVVRSIVEHLDAAPAGPIRVLSLCAGDAQDLVRAATDHPRADDLVGAVVELDGSLSALARRGLAEVAPGVEVRQRDAGVLASFADVVAVDLLLLCGVFGNVADADVERTVRAVPSLCHTGATVIWTRHRRAPDLTPAIRSWFDDVGCTAVRWESPGAGKFAIGTERVGAGSHVAPPPVLFRFLDDAW